MIACLCAFVQVLAALPQQDAGGPPQREIDQAIHKGTEYLKTAPSPGATPTTNCDELILLTFVVAEVDPQNSRFRELLQGCLKPPLVNTYKVALLAMALEELDASRYQMKIAQCGQFLADTQAKNGQWSYGYPTDLKKWPFDDSGVKTSSAPRKGDARQLGSAPRERKKPARALEIVRQGVATTESGDNSNTAYAALGLRACHDANVRIPQDVVQLACTWWNQSQWADESGAPVVKGSIATGMDTPRVRGWSYLRANEPGNAYGSMTAGGVGAKVILQYMLGLDFRKDESVRAGVNWLAKHYVIAEDYYCLYALERAGMLYDTPTFGDHPWYAEGARLLGRRPEARRLLGEARGRRAEHLGHLLRDPLPQEGHPRSGLRRPEEKIDFPLRACLHRRNLPLEDGGHDPRDRSNRFRAARRRPGRAPRTQ
jgi:hypothetical protein